MLAWRVCHISTRSHGARCGRSRGTAAARDRPGLVSGLDACFRARSPSRVSRLVRARVPLLPGGGGFVPETRVGRHDHRRVRGAGQVARHRAPPRRGHRAARPALAGVRGRRDQRGRARARARAAPRGPAPGCAPARALRQVRGARRLRGNRVALRGDAARGVDGHRRRAAPQRLHEARAVQFARGPAPDHGRRRARSAEKTRHAGRDVLVVLLRAPRRDFRRTGDEARAARGRRRDERDAPPGARLGGHGQGAELHERGRAHGEGLRGAHPGGGGWGSGGWRRI